MRQQLKTFIDEVIQDIVGLDVALFFQAHPGVFDTATGIAMKMGRTAEEVAGPLERLADAGILERYDLGAGRHRCYTLKRTDEVWSALCRLSELYLDNPSARREIIRMLIERRRRQRQEADAAQKGENADK
ncbi:MAG: hypothetical protein H5T86_07030 [Armatimonadetes bacterium]|nr:hypothetical protein [Armatimonadota bacterium]